MKIEFGTGGWRVDLKDFTAENITKIIYALCQYLSKHVEGTAYKIVIGYDNRENGYECAKMLFSGLTTFSNSEVRLFNRSVSTPTVMKYTQDYKCDLGLMVTASHNPGNFNGIKVFTFGGRDAIKETTDTLEYFAKEADTDCHISIVDYDNSADIPYSIIDADMFENKFVADCLADINIQNIRKAQLHIKVDAMHSSGLKLLQKLTDQLNVTTDIFNTIQAIPVSYTPCPTAANNKELAAAVNKGLYSFGISMDGDGDRLGVVDDKGEFIDGNLMLGLFTWYMYKYKHLNSPVAVSCCATGAIQKIAKSFNSYVIETPVGVKYLINKVFSDQVKFAGEQNGGVIFPKHMLGKDAIYTFAILLDMVATTGKRLSELCAYIQDKYQFPTCIAEQMTFIGDKANVESKLRTANINFGKPIQNISTLDGIKVVFDLCESVIYRLSGTEPIIRILSESQSAEEAQKYIDTCKAYFKQEGIIE